MLLIAENFQKCSEFFLDRKHFDIVADGQGTEYLMDANGAIKKFFDPSVWYNNSAPVSYPVDGSVSGPRNAFIRNYPQFGNKRMLQIVDNKSFNIVNFKKSKRVVLGLNIGQALCNETPYYSNYSNFYWSNQIYAYTGFSSHPNIRHTFTCYCDALKHFEISLGYKQSSIDFYMKSFGTGAVNILSQNLYADLEHRFFLEIFIDITNSSAGLGRVKCRINGDDNEMFDLGNLVCSDYIAYLSDNNNPLSYINKINFAVTGYYSSDDSYPSHQMSGFPEIGDIYLCNEDGGYQNDFLGPVEITSIDPMQDGDQCNWTPNGVDVAAGNHSAVSKSFLTVSNQDSAYVETEMHLNRDMFYFDASPIDMQHCDIIAVIHRVLYKQTYTVVMPKSALVPLSKASGRDMVFERSKGSTATDFIYNINSAIYGIFPSLAVQWTWDLLLYSQFGYLYHDTIFNHLVTESIVATDDATDA